MAEEAPGAAFDQKERTHVRRALLRYMAEHRIGAPTLQSRIIKADKPRHRVIPLSTLQRFIADTRHTSDHHVALCYTFARELPYYGEGRDVTQLGEALFDFLQGQVEGSERKALIERVAALAGSYQSGLLSLTLDQADGQPYLFAEEIGFFPPDDLESTPPDAMPARRRVYEGVLVLTSSSINMFLRNTLTRQLKLCHLWLREDPEDKDRKALHGQSFEPGMTPTVPSFADTVFFDRVGKREDV